MDGEEAIPWSGPSLDTRADFLTRMQSLSQNISEIQPEETNEVEGEIVEPNLRKLENLISAGDAAEAFFLARSLFTSGDEWAEEWMLKAQEML
jgi:hypothetical protein